MGDKVQDGYNKQMKIYTDLMLIENIENNSIYKFYLHFKMPILIAVLDLKNFVETQSILNDSLKSSQNLIKVNIKDISIKTPGINHIEQKIKNTPGIQLYYQQTFVIINVLNDVNFVV